MFEGVLQRRAPEVPQRRQDVAAPGRPGHRRLHGRAWTQRAARLQRQRSV